MKDDKKAKLGKILADFEAQRASANKAADRANTAHEEFLENFTALAKSTIRPAMEEVIEQLRASGHDAAIKEEQERREHDSKTRGASIMLYVYPLGQKSRYFNENDCPHFGVIANTSKDTVYTHESTMMPGRGGSAGGGGEFHLDQISSDLVHDRILHVLSSAMGK